MYTKLPNGQIVYAEDISCVVDPINGKGGIYIGNLQASQNIKTLKKYGIKAVLTAAKSILLDHPKSEVPYYLHVPGQDKDGFDLSRFFPQSVNFIRDSLEKTNILVHCLAGVSRSVSLVIAYLIKCKGMSYENAYQMLKSRRKIIHPNDGFISQLQKYERQMNFEKPYPRENEYRGYSASPTKMRRYEDPAIENYEESHYRNRQYCNYSPSRKADHYESPNKKRDYNYLGRVELSESPSKKYHPLESESRVKNLGCLDQNKFHYEYNPEKSKVENYLPRGRTYSDIKTDDKNTLQYGRSRVKGNDISNLNEELDEKIARIRQKYAQYTNSEIKTSPRRCREPKYNNFFDENDFGGGLKLKKISSDYNADYEPLYGVVKRNYQRPTGLGLRKLNSMKDY